MVSHFEHRRERTAERWSDRWGTWMDRLGSDEDATGEQDGPGTEDDLLDCDCGDDGVVDLAGADSAK